jgi:hypothetical protein
LGDAVDHLAGEDEFVLQEEARRALFGTVSDR